MAPPPSPDPTATGGVPEMPRPPEFGVPGRSHRRSVVPATSGPASFGPLPDPDAPAPHADAPVRSVLVVCTGNICRSPFAELLLAALAPGVRTASRGTFALVGHPMDSLMAAELARRGVDPSPARAGQVAPADLDADLVLTMSENHRRFLRDERPEAMRRTGLLGAADDLAALVGDGEVLTIGHVERWARRRQDPDLRVPDPYRRGAAAAAEAAERLERLVRTVAAVLAPPDAHPGAIDRRPAP